MFFAIAQRALPNARTFAAPGLPAKRKDLRFDEVLGDAAPAAWAGQMEQVVIGNRVMREVVFRHRASRTLIAVDLVENVRDETPGTDRVMRAWLHVLGMWGRARPAPELRWMTRDREAAPRALERMLAWDFERARGGKGFFSVVRPTSPEQEALSYPSVARRFRGWGAASRLLNVARNSNSVRSSPMNESRTFSVCVALAASMVACSDGADAPLDRASAALAGTTSIVAAHSNKCIDVQVGSSDNGASIIQWDCHGGANQTFEIKPLADGTHHIVASHSGKCLDVFQARSDNGTPIVQWECNDTYPNQRFDLVPLSDGTVQIRSAFTGKCVDVYRGVDDNGAKVIEWDCVESYRNQHFTLRSLTGSTPSPTPAPTTSSPPPAPPPPPSTPPPSSGVPTESSVGFRGDPASLNRGVPSGASQSGNTVFLVQDGQVIDGFDFSERNIVVKANDVVIRNSLFTTGGYWDVLQDTGYSGLVVEDSTFDGKKRNDILAAAIWSYTGATSIRRNKFVDMPSDVVNVRGGTVESNYFAGSSYASGAHADAIYIPSTSSPMVVRNNYVDFRTRADAPQGTNNCVRITTEGGGSVSNVRITDNVFRGGNGYTLSVTSVATGVVIQNNQLEDTTVYGEGNYYFYPSYPPDLVWSGNTDYLTGAPAPMK